MAYKEGNPERKITLMTLSKIITYLPSIFQYLNPLLIRNYGDSFRQEWYTIFDKTEDNIKILINDIKITKCPLVKSGIENTQLIYSLT